MGDLTSGTTQDTSNLKLNFEANLQILAEQFEVKYREDNDYIRTHDLADTLVDFYKEAEKLCAKVNTSI